MPLMISADRVWTVVTLATTVTRAAAIARWARRTTGVEPVVLTRPFDPRAWVELYFATPEPAAAFRDVATGRDGIAAVGMRFERLRDWATAWRQRFQPILIGGRLQVTTSGRNRKDNSIPTLWIKPGLGFGTGQHFTTRFCLERIVERCKLRPRPRSLLDIGTGSGILALAGARLGIPRVVGTDCDLEALATAAANARRNRLDHHVKWIADDVVHSRLRGRFELVVANLYGAVLVRCARYLAQVAGRLLIISGVQEFEADAVSHALAAAGFTERLRDGDGQWCGLEFIAAPRKPAVPRRAI